jgi:hypothetical protein
MEGLKKFAAIYIAIIVVGSAFTISWATMLNRPTIATETAKTHFSVIWTGFKPTYSDEYPDYYVCVNNLKDASLKMYVQLKIENYENVSLYFMINQYTTPPADWFVGPQYFGLVLITNPIAYFTYSNLNRTKPASITGGSLHESVEVVVQAYYDEGYTQFYSQDNFTINFHFIDVTSPAWTRLEYYNFDDQTTQGWSGSLHKWQYYRSWPCSLTGSSIYRNFDLIGNYTEAYFVAAVWQYAHSPRVYLDDVLCFMSEMPPSSAAWHQIAIPLPLNKVIKVQVSSVSYLDDAYILAK